MRVWVGTSGWQYDSWRGRFYPEKLAQRAWLEFYAERFRCVEVNNTFYRLPGRDVFAGWERRTPDDFMVVVKASRYLSHIRRLLDAEEPVATLMERASALGAKLGPVLLQLPPSMTADTERLDAALASFGSAVRVALEPRHASWFAEPVYDVLRRHGAALVLTDRRNRRGPIVRTADWAYVRLHEGTASPRPCYGEDALSWWVRTLESTGVGEAWVFFNNDPLACAIDNARTFARLAAAAGLASTRAG